MRCEQNKRVHNYSNVSGPKTPRKELPFTEMKKIQRGTDLEGKDIKTLVIIKSL